MNNKRTKGENVYQLVQKRLKFLFNEFDNIYVSFSGGKDSGVLLNLCIQYIREHNLDRKIGVYHMDYEAQYQMTTEYVEQTFRENQDILEIYHVCVPFKVVTCASMFQTYWRPWDESMHAHWVMLRKKGKKPLLVAGDVYRPAAIKQLQVLGEQLSLPVFEPSGITAYINGELLTVNGEQAVWHMFVVHRLSFLNKNQ